MRVQWTTTSCRSTPTDPDVGVLAEVFRRRTGTRVSDHPEGRFGAAGALAAQLVEDVPWHDYYGPGSPLERFVAAGGIVECLDDQQRHRRVRRRVDGRAPLTRWTHDRS